jgi:hypothetical protein
MMVETAYRNELNRGAHGVADAAHHTGEARRHVESRTARTLEERTARIGSDRWLWASFGSMAASLTLQLMGRQHLSLFVGQWAAPFMLIGVYNKLVKIAGSDRLHA